MAEVYGERRLNTRGRQRAQRPGGAGQRTRARPVPAWLLSSLAAGTGRHGRWAGRRDSGRCPARLAKRFLPWGRGRHGSGVSTAALQPDAVRLAADHGACWQIREAPGAKRPRASTGNTQPLQQASQPKACRQAQSAERGRMPLLSCSPVRCRTGLVRRVRWSLHPCRHVRAAAH